MMLTTRHCLLYETIAPGFLNLIWPLFSLNLIVNLFLAKNNEGKRNPAICKVVHTKPETKLFWYIDDNYITTTQTFHEIPILPQPGEHTITVTDELGYELKRHITIEY